MDRDLRSGKAGDRRPREDTRSHQARYEQNRSRSPPRRERRDDRRRDRSPPRGPASRAGPPPPPPPPRSDRDRDRDRGYRREGAPARGRPGTKPPPPPRAPPDARTHAAAAPAGARDPHPPTARTADGAADEDPEAEMRRIMGFAHFRSTKNTKVPGNDKNHAIYKVKKAEYRQYMNRQGGFNRPLSPSRN